MNDFFFRGNVLTSCVCVSRSVPSFTDKFDTIILRRLLFDFAKSRIASENFIVSLVELYTSASDCKSVENNPRSHFVKAFSALLPHS